MMWERMTAADWVKFLIGISGPTIAAAITGGLLVYQSKRNDQREVDKHLREQEEARRTEAVQARDQWVAAFQEVLSTMAQIISNTAPYVHSPEHAKRVLDDIDLIKNLTVRARVATSRLLLVERTEFVRTRVHALGLHFDGVIGPDANHESAKAKLTEVDAEFSAFLDDLAGVKSPVGRAKRLKDSLVAHSGLPPEQIQELSKEIDEIRKGELTLPGSVRIIVKPDNR